MYYPFLSRYLFSVQPGRPFNADALFEVFLHPLNAVGFPASLPKTDTNGQSSVQDRAWPARMHVYVHVKLGVEWRVDSYSNGAFTHMSTSRLAAADFI